MLKNTDICAQQLISILVKVLILRFSSIGDIVLTTPVIRCVKQQIPNVEVHFATKQAFEPVLKNNPYLDQIFYLKGNISELIKSLQAEQYDYVIDLHSNIRTARIKLALGKPSYTFDKLNIEKWLLVNLKVDRMPHLHIVDRYLDTVKALGVMNDGKGLDYFLSPDDTIDKPQHYIAFAIGAQHATKRLPKEKIAAVCQLIDHPIVLLGGKEDAETGQWIAQQAGQHVHNYCGQYKLNQSAYVVLHADVVITHDTGLMHVAAAFGKKIISIWGNTVPAFGMTPYLPQNSPEEQAQRIIEIKDLSCRPCSKIGYATCPKKHFKCMNLIDEKWVAERVLQAMV